MSDSPTDKPPVDTSLINKLLDVGVFAPLGFLLKRDDVVAELADAGRKQIQFTRSLGRAALRGLASGATAPKPSPAQPKSKPPSPSVVEDYDALSARQVIEMVPQCTPEQAAWIKTRETKRKNRVTVLRALEARDGQ